MKKVVAFLMFSVLLFNSSVFAQNKRSVKTEPVLQSDAVIYDRIDAYSDGGGVWIEWQTASETKNLGFYVYRQAGKGKELVDQKMVGGVYQRTREDRPISEKYNYFDQNGNGSTVYYLETLNADGRRQFSNPIFPKYVSNIKDVAGASSQALRQAKTSSNSEIITNKPIFPKEQQSATGENALAADPITQRWVAAQPGVKIYVKKEGFFRVTRAELQNAGFNVNTNADLWQLYVNGIEQSIIVGGNGDYIEFYGKGADKVETDSQVYFLLVGTQNGKRIGPRTLRPNGGNVVANNYAQTTTYSQRLYYITNALNGEGNNFFGQPVTGVGTTVTFNLTGIDTSTTRTGLRISIQGSSLTEHHIRVILNGHEIDPILGDAENMMTQDYGVPTNFLNNGANTLQLTALAGGNDTSYFDSIAVSYNRLYTVQNNQLSFYTNNFRTSNLQGFTSPNIRIFDISFPDTPSLLVNLPVTQNGANYSVRLPATRGIPMFAVEDSAIQTVSSIVQNVPSSYSTTSLSANLVIITYKDWVNEANTWKAYRQAQGLTVEVINVEEIYDEFGYGSMSTLGIRAFLQYAKNNWQTQYAMFLGDAHYDFRNYEGNGYHNYIPTRMVDTVYMETGSDESLADFNDDGLAELAVGRIVARNPQHVTQAYNKTLTFEANVISQWLTRGVLFTYDEPNGYDFLALSENLRQYLPANMPVTYIGKPQANSRNANIAAMNTGKYLVNYSGHGSTGFWSDPSFFNYNDALALTNGNNLSIFMMLTCLNGFFINSSESLAESLMKAPNGGSVAAWTSSAKTTPDVQEDMAERFFSQLSLGNMTRMGDLVKDAKTALVGGRDVRLSWILFGDPTLKVR